jgi:tRNA(Arg) A34 adenosine deaminase TadA
LTLKTGKAMLNAQEISFLERAIGLARQGMERGEGGPFGCVIVKDNEIIAEGNNKVTSSNDPTAHAEVVAIREACNKLHSFQLEGCDVYTSCEPCPMCLGAIYWARPRRVVYANTREEAAAIDFDDNFIYEEISAPVGKRKIPFIHAPQPSASEIFVLWKNWAGKQKY